MPQLTLGLFLPQMNGNPPAGALGLLQRSLPHFTVHPKLMKPDGEFETKCLPCDAGQVAIQAFRPSPATNRATKVLQSPSPPQSETLGSPKQTRPFPKTVFDSLPIEIADRIMGYVETCFSPLEAFALKISCRCFFHTSHPLSSYLKPLKRNSWDLYVAKVLCEDPKSERLLCYTCRNIHPRAQFDQRNLERSGFLRSCKSQEAAIELCQSKLKSYDIRQMLMCGPGQLFRPRSPLLPTVPYKMAYPNPSFRVGVQTGASMVWQGTVNQPYLHSPLWHVIRGNRCEYVMVQEISVLNDYTILTGFVVLRGLSLSESRLDEPPFDNEARCQELRNWFSSVKVDGGLWACPHIPFDSEGFCIAALKSLWVWRFNRQLKPSLGCPVCCAYITILALGRRDTAARPDLLRFQLTVSIQRNLGLLSDLAVERSPSFNEVNLMHFSNRLSPRNQRLGHATVIGGERQVAWKDAISRAGAAAGTPETIVNRGITRGRGAIGSHGAMRSRGANGGR